MKKNLLLCVIAFVLSSVGTAFAQYDEGIGFYVAEDGIYAEVDGRERHVGILGFSDEPFFGFGAVYTISPDRRAVAYIGEEKGGNGIYVFRSGEKFDDNVPAYGDITYLSKPVWSPDSRYIAFSMGGRIWIYELDSDEAWIVVEPFPELEFMQDIDPEFSDDGETLFFYRGDFFEFQFGGELFAVDLYNGELVQMFPDDPKYPLFMDLVEQSMDVPFGGFAPDMELMDLKIQLFIEDLVAHDHSRLFLYFDPEYVNEQRYIMEAYEEGLHLHIFNSFFFNGAVRYADYKNTISDLYEIDEAVHFEYDPEIERLLIVVRLRDGREVSFSVSIDPYTLLFFGPFG